MSDIIGRIASLGSLTPEIMMQLLSMMIDAVGTGEEWTGENLDRLGELTRQLADKVAGQSQAKSG